MNTDSVISASGDRFRVRTAVWRCRLVRAIEGHAGRNMTLGIYPRPEHIALSSRAEGGVPLTTGSRWRFWARIIWRMGAGAIRNWWCGWRIQQRPAASSTLWLHLPEHQRRIFCVAKRDNVYE